MLKYITDLDNKLWQYMHFHSFPHLILMYYKQVNNSETTSDKLLF